MKFLIILFGLSISFSFADDLRYRNTLLRYPRSVHDVDNRDLLWSTEPLADRYGRHYVQHDNVVSNAKKGVQNRLHQLGVNYDFQTNNGRSSNLETNYGPELCLYPCERAQFSNNIGSAVGSKHYSANVLIPAAESSSKLSYSASQHREHYSPGAPIVIPVVSDSETYQSQLEHMKERQSTATYPIYYPSSQRSSSRSAGSETDIRVNTAPAAAYPPVSTYKEEVEENKKRYSEINQLPVSTRVESSPSYTSRQPDYNAAQRNSLQVPYYPSSNTERYSSRAEQLQERQSVPVAVVSYPSSWGSSASEHQSSEMRKFSQTSLPVVQVKPVVYPVHSATSRQSSKEVEQHYPSSLPQQLSSQRYNSDRNEDSLNTVHVHAPVYPTTESSSRYAASNRQEMYKSEFRQPIIVPAQSSSSASSSSHYSQQKTHSSLSQPTYVAAIPSSSSLSYARGSNFNEERARSALADREAQSSRLGSIAYNSDSNLSHYMSESERLAKEQQHTSQSSGTLVGSSILDADFAKGTNSLSGNLEDIAQANGYTRAKSWERNSKWSSGSQYDESGKLKSYNTLSTGESEQHHVNGETTGYKAATTTLDDDGKVSTYSVHTP